MLDSERHMFRNETFAIDEEAFKIYMDKTSCTYLLFGDVPYRSPKSYALLDFLIFVPKIPTYNKNSLKVHL